MGITSMTKMLHGVIAAMSQFSVTIVSKPLMGLMSRTCRAGAE